MISKASSKAVLFASALLALPFGLSAAEKAVVHQRAQSQQQVGFNVYLPLQHRDQLVNYLATMHDPQSGNYRHWLKPSEFNRRYGVTDQQRQAVLTQLAAYGLQAEVASPHRIHVTGTAAAVEQAFGTQLKNASFRNGKQVVIASTALTKTGALAQTNAVISGLSGMIRMRSHAIRTELPQNRQSATGGYWFDDLKQAYSYPSYQKYDGTGTTIGILMSNDFRQADMDAYFSHEKLATPKLSRVNINGGAPFDVDLSTETHLDMQQSGGMAPKAHIILYNIPDLSDDNIMAGLEQIIDDNKADVVNMSFGGPEVFYTAAYNDGEDETSILQQEDDLFAQGNAQGITFVASSGDEGGLAGIPLACFTNTDLTAPCGSVFPAAEFPATSPHVTGVGGTNLITTFTPNSGSLNSQYVRESAFFDPLDSDIFYGTAATGSVWGSGGGDSIVFRKPLFQSLVNTGNPKFRTVPDLSLHMGGCPVGSTTCGSDDSFDWVQIGGQTGGVIGTSAAAPDFTGLLALAVQRLGTRLGNENYYIYSLALAQSVGVYKNVFRTGIPGDNGAFSTTSHGYNRVLGNGTVDGINFLLGPKIAPAGVPQTPSNP